MSQDKIFAMPFSKIYPLLITKAERKGRSREEVDLVTCWLTGYTPQDLSSFLEQEISYKDFFEQAPMLNENRHLIKGSVCGVRLDGIEDPLMREIRYLDKLVDELARGRSLDNILRK